MSYNVFILDPSIFRWWLAGQNYKERRVETVQTWRAIEGADLCFNLGIFGFQTGLGCSYVRAKGKDIAYGSEKPQILVLNNENQCRGYSDGIINGQVRINLPMKGASLRNGVGMTDRGFLIVAQTSHSVTETVFCNQVNSIVKARGHSVKLFTLQDGGGSVAATSNITKISTGGSRKVANVLCVSFKQTPSFTMPIYNGRKGDEAGIMQTALLIDADKDFGANSTKRLNQSLAALGLPKGMQSGMADYYAMKKMGFKILY